MSDKKLRFYIFYIHLNTIYETPPRFECTELRGNKTSGYRVKRGRTQVHQARGGGKI